MTTDTDQNGTRERLLRTASQAFAELGYREATVAEICRRAGANVAAVNYYFRSKEKLYVEAWRAAFHRGLRKYPPDGGLDADAPPEQRLRARMTAMIRRAMDPESVEFDIIRREMSDPTGLLEDARRELIDELRRRTLETVREMLGPKATLGQVLLGALSAMSPILHAVHRIRHVKAMDRAGHTERDDLFLGDPEPLIDHNIEFFLGGLRRMREGIEAGAWPDVQLPEAFLRRHHDLLEETE